MNDFRARLAAARLREPTDEQLCSLRSARIDFNPFQYRPILRLLHDLVIALHHADVRAPAAWS